MTPRDNKKRWSVRIQRFQAEQLDELADAYDEIRARLNELRALTRVRLPPKSDPKERLTALRDLDASGKLTIRITGAGKLRVRALLMAKCGGRAMYAVVLRATAKKH